MAGVDCAANSRGREGISEPSLPLESDCVGFPVGSSFTDGNLTPSGGVGVLLCVLLDALEGLFVGGFVVLRWPTCGGRNRPSSPASELGSDADFDVEDPDSESGDTEG
jgi:hypothetical protein